MPVLRTLLSCCFALAAFAQAPTGLPGHWTGMGRFHNVRFQTQFGSLPFDLRIGPDLTLTGTVGGARIQPSRVVTRKDRQDFYAELEGEIRPGKAFRKRRLVLLVTHVEGNRLVADFHLKTNFVWDWTMRQGTLEAARKD